jgi:hypothetical protein
MSYDSILGSKWIAFDLFGGARGIKMVAMAKKQPASQDRHKPRRMTSVPERMAKLLEEIAATKETNLATEVKQAVREYLERAGLWPPKRE